MIFHGAGPKKRKESVVCDTYGRIDTTTLRAIYRSSAREEEEDGDGGWKTEGRVVFRNDGKDFAG